MGFSFLGFDSFLGQFFDFCTKKMRSFRDEGTYLTLGGGILDFSGFIVFYGFSDSNRPQRPSLEFASKGHYLKSWDFPFRACL